MTFQDIVFPAAATIFQLLPPTGVVPQWKHSTDARRWIAIWCITFFLSDALQLAVALTQGRNIFLFIFVEPLEDAILLWALSYWQVRPVSRIALRIVLPLMIATYIAIAIAAGEQDSYKTFSGPFRALMIMLWTAFTLVSNIAHNPERVWNRDWLWTSLGVLLYFGLLVSTEPIIAAMGVEQLEAMRRVLNVRALGDVFAFILIWRGMRCPIRDSSSGST